MTEASKCGMTEDEVLADWVATAERQRMRRHAANVRAGRDENGYMGRGVFVGPRARAGYGSK
jgi:uncharacterized protein YndB with AHSA1/START domain